MTREPDPLARLTVDLGQLAERVNLVEQFATEVVGELADKVTQLAAAVQVPASPQQPDAQQADARPWAALVKEGHGEGTPLADLITWIDSVLIPQYGEYLDLPASATGTLPLCWARHPAACNELWTLYVLWAHAYTSEKPVPRDAGDWHDRWLPGTLVRLKEVFKGCLHGETSRTPEVSRPYAQVPTG